MNRSRNIRSLAVKVAILTALVSSSASADREPERPHTWSQSVSQVNAACLLKWISASAPEFDGYRWMQYEVVDVLKGPKLVKRGDRLKLRRLVEGQKDSLFFILGMKEPRGSIDWEEAIPATRAGFDYLSHAPAFGGSARKRLPYFLKFLGSTDPFIAPDVLAEFRQVRFEDLIAFAPSLPRDKLRQRTADPKTPPPEMGQYGLLLSLCGDARDAELLAAKIREKGDDLRVGIEGAMAGYLFLTGTAGLDNLDAWTLNNKSGSLVDVYAGMRALNFMWAKGNGKIKKERLIRSMRLVLDCPVNAPDAIENLARWKDWGSQERIVGMYDLTGSRRRYNIAIIEYLLASTHANPAGSPEQAAVKKYLEQLRTKDPKTVGEVERYNLQKTKDNQVR